MGGIELGDTCEDIVTGVQGIVTAMTEYLHECVRVQLEYKNNGEAASAWFALARLALITT